MQNLTQIEMQAIEKSCQDIDEMSKTTGLSSGIAKSMVEAFRYSALAQKVMDLLNPQVMSAVFVPLKNKEFGWREDRPGQYPLEVLRDVWVGALVKGALPTNDEVLVISGRAYYQKNFFRRKLAQLEGFSEMTLLPGKCTAQPTGALVEMTASCKFHGKEIKIVRTGQSAIPVRLNNGQGVDAAFGKAERKIMCSLFNQLTGSAFAEGEAEESDFMATPKPVERIEAQSHSEPEVHKATLQDPVESAAVQKNPEPAPVVSKAEEIKQQVAAKRGRPVKEKAPDEAAPWVNPPQQSAPVQQSVQQAAPTQAVKVEPVSSQQPPTEDGQFDSSTDPVTQSGDEVLEEATVITAIKATPKDKDGKQVFTLIGHTDAVKFVTTNQAFAVEAKNIAVKSGTYKKDVVKTPEDALALDQKIHGLIENGGTAIIEYTVDLAGGKLVVGIKDTCIA